MPTDTPAQDPRWEPLEVAPSGRYGFVRPDGRWSHIGPAVQVVQLIERTGTWSPTPALYYADSFANPAQDPPELAIDLGAGWYLPPEDTAALAVFARAALNA